MPVSTWATERLGPAAERLQEAVVAAIPRAHHDAVAAQVASGTAKRDPYGHTMKNRQHECLVEDARDIPGIKIVRPAGASFELVTVPETRAVLYPWRFATDNARDREHVRMPTSIFRRELLTGLSRQASGQLGLHQADWDDALLAEDEAVVEQLRSLVRVVTVGYRSNVAGLTELGWGDLELIDGGGGAIWWRHWEPLELVLAPRRTVPTATGPTSFLPAPESGNERTSRWDEASEPERLGLSARSPLDGDPDRSPTAARDETGTADGAS